MELDETRIVVRDEFRCYLFNSASILLRWILPASWLQSKHDYCELSSQFIAMLLRFTAFDRDFDLTTAQLLVEICNQKRKVRSARPPDFSIRSSNGIGFST